MTLVARTRNHFTPTIIADLLLTGRNIDGPIILPTIGLDISHLIPEDEAKPVTLAQKLYILNDNICVAFAGLVSEIKDILEDFRLFCSLPGVNTKRLLEFTKEYDYSNFKESAYFMMIIENNGPGKVFVTEITYGDFKKRDNGVFDEIRSIGSGSEDFDSIINEKIEFTSSFKDGEILQGITKKAALIARLLVEERYMLRPLQNKWGGGYELAYYNTHKLVKLDNTAYVLQTGNFVENGEVGILLPLMIIFHKYKGDDLIITSVEMHDLTMEYIDDFIIMKSKVLRAGKYLVPQIKRGIAIDDIGPVESFSTYSVGMGFLIDTPSKQYFKPSFYTNSFDLEIIFSKEDKVLLIRMHKRLQAHINMMFKERYRNFV